MNYVDFNLRKVHCITGSVWGKIGMGLTAAAGAYKYKSQMDAAKDVKKAGERNAAAIREESAEEVRRRELANKQKISETRARAGASGGTIDYGSTANYLSEMKKTFNAEVDWLKKSGSTRAQNEILRSSGEASSLKSGAYAGAFNTAGRMLSAFR